MLERALSILSSDAGQKIILNDEEFLASLIPFLRDKEEKTVYDTLKIFSTLSKTQDSDKKLNRPDLKKNLSDLTFHKNKPIKQLSGDVYCRIFSNILPKQRLKHRIIVQLADISFEVVEPVLKKTPGLVSYTFQSEKNRIVIIALVSLTENDLIKNLLSVANMSGQITLIRTRNSIKDPAFGEGQEKDGAHNSTPEYLDNDADKFDASKNSYLPQLVDGFIDNISSSFFGDKVKETTSWFRENLYW